MRGGSDQLCEPWEQCFRYDEEPGAAVRKHETVVLLGHKRVDRNGDDTGLDGAEECGGPVDRIEEREHDALFLAHPEGAQHMPEARDALGKSSIGPRAPRIDEGSLVGAAGGKIALDHVRGKVVVARNALDRLARIERCRPC